MEDSKKKYENLYSRRALILNIAQAYTNATNSVNNAKNQLILVTAAGLIMGTPLDIPESEEEILDNLTLSQEINKHYKEQLDKIEEEHPDLEYIDNSARIVLKDVTITSSSNPPLKTKLPELFVFADQIIGFYLGTADPV
jgi:hypothetical protein